MSTVTVIQVRQCVHSIVSLGITYKKLSYRWQTSRRV